MFDKAEIEELDAAGACEAIAAAHRASRLAEAQQLRLAAHWLDLHAPVEHPDSAEDSGAAGRGGRAGAGGGRVVPGTERVVASGADGTPMISEFAAAEFAALQEMSPAAGQARLRKVANLRHRHPVLWARAVAGEVPAWKALETARLVGRTEAGQPPLPLEGARFVDVQTASWIDTLPWAAYLELVARMVVAADPARAEHCRVVAAAEQYVVTGQSSEHGLKTLIAKANAGEVIYLVAVLDQLAEVLRLRGDTRELPARRAAALGILAHPAHALALLASQLPATPDDASDDRPSDSPTESPAEGQGPAAPAAGDDSTANDRGDDPGADDHRADDDNDTTPDGSEPADPADASCEGLPSYLKLPAGADPDLVDGEALGILLARARPVDLERLLPKAVLHLHMSLEAYLMQSRPGLAPQAVNAEGIGPLTIAQAREWLGHHRVTIAPVLDPDAVAAVNGYHFTRSQREALHAINPRDVFPYGVHTGRGKDVDHPVPYRWTGTGPPGAPPGQTGLHNAAPMVRHHHRLKTHGGWRLTQLARGVYLWRSIHGHHWVTDPTGTYRVPTSLAEALHDLHATARPAA